jgi:Cft2 family RNA processing exonuclease
MTSVSTERTVFEFHGGLHLRDTVLWFDAPRARQLSFISHANIPGAMAHQKILATDRTAELLTAFATADGRGRHVHVPQALVTPYGRPFSLGQLNLELFPSGHVLGSASLLVQYRGQSIVYAGDINSRRSPLVERLEVRHCDVLALSCRFGERRFAFPPAAQVAEALVRFARDAIGRGVTPVFFSAPLGDAQEVARLLLEAKIRVRAHRQIHAAARIYARAGTGLEGVRAHAGPAATTETALLWPSRLRNSPALLKLGATCTAFVSGMALDESARTLMRCDAAFALSSHADYPGLLEYVKVSRPGKVVLTGGQAGEIFEDLRALGITVSRAGPPRQMDLF